MVNIEQEDTRNRESLFFVEVPFINQYKDEVKKRRYFAFTESKFA